MRAVLWDGTKQLQGNISFEEESLIFSFDDFSSTNLSFQLSYSDIKKVEIVRIFNIAASAIKLISTDGNKNVIVPENLDEFLENLEVRR